MHSVEQALEIVLGQATPLPAVTAALTAETLGLVLAEDIVSDLDMPPFAQQLTIACGFSATLYPATKG